MERLVQQRGFKAVHGRILACLFLAEHPRTQQEISEWTGYSVSAISRALEQLMMLGSVRRHKKAGIRSHSYGIGTSIAGMIVGALTRWVTMIHEVQVPFTEIARTADRLDTTSLPGAEVLEVKLLVQQMKQLEITLSKAEPVLQDMLTKLQTLVPIDTV